MSQREIAPYKYPRAIEFVTEVAQDRERKAAAFHVAADGAGERHARKTHDGGGMTAPTKIEGDRPVTAAKANTVAILPATKDQPPNRFVRRCCSRAAGRGRKATPTA